MDTSVLNTPKSTSLLQPTKYQVMFDKIPNVIYFCKLVKFPGVMLPEVSQPTPFINRNMPGNKLEYEPLVLEFIVDEGLTGWTEIHNWMKSLGIRESYEDYKGLNKSNKVSFTAPFPQYGQCTLYILSTQNNPKVQVDFIDCFPVLLSSFTFDSSNEKEDTITASATFKFFYYNIKRLD